MSIRPIYLVAWSPTYGRGAESVNAQRRLAVDERDDERDQGQRLDDSHTHDVDLICSPAEEPVMTPLRTCFLYTFTQLISQMAF